MQRELGIFDDDAIVQPQTFDRKEIEFRVINCHTSAKEKKLENLIRIKLPEDFNESFADFYSKKGNNTNCGLVFCTIAGENVWKNGKYHPFSTRNIQHLLNSWLPEQGCGIYNGKIGSKEKKENARNFKHNELVALSITKAFGMGIDKPNIRWAVHYGIPSSIESYYQEAGRCARDGKLGISYILLSNDYQEDNRDLLDSKKVDISQLAKENGRIKGSKPWEGDDISRNIFFHLTSFTGAEEELKHTKFVIDELVKGNLQIPFYSENNKMLEKAIFRLRIIGYISDYMVNYEKNTFDVEIDGFSPEKIEQHYREYISRYQEDEGYIANQIRLLKDATGGYEETLDLYLQAAIKTLLSEFTYKIVEEGRRKAMLNMLDISTESANEADIKEGGVVMRKKILDYLSTSETIKFQDLLTKSIDIKEWNAYLKGINTKKTIDTEVLRINRQLEAYPEHFGLHYALYKTNIKQKNKEDIIKSMNNALYYGIERYDMDKSLLYENVIKPINNVNLEKVDYNNLYSIVKEDLGEEYLLKILEDIEKEEMREVYLSNKLNSIIDGAIKEVANT